MTTAMLIGLFLTNLFVTGVKSIGVCNGQLGDNLPIDQDVVNHCKANGIRKLRLYAPKIETLEALKGSNFFLILGAPNVQELASDPSVASQWVKTNVVPYWPGIQFKYIAVGNEIDPASEVAQFVHPAMINMHNALTSEGLGEVIKVSTATWPSILGVSYPPSQATFRDDARAFLDPIIKFLDDTQSQLLVNIYPYFSYKGNPQDISLSYALFTSQEVVVSDEGLGYTNLFDAILDSIYAALEKAGSPLGEVVVSESGWPSDGGFAASVENAGTYYTNLINHVKSGNNTPRRPQTAIDVYLFGMFDENLKVGDETEKHFGLFTPDMQPKYQISF